MMISIRVRGIEWTDELHKEVERSVAFAVDRYQTHVNHVSVYLVDLNGPKGGADKLCQMTATLRSGDRVFILEKGSEIVPTVNSAVDRLRYRIGRGIRRWRRPAAQRTGVYDCAA